ncbi:bifunctional proline dehydrogenase/L-glutamate gamma-semialdehyde dehydrogenase PutA [Parvularcula sp. IMCC14364]|uniref:bifunctional proline dehydrogenase/L-glutamate gamma-semialdehyde dehydrogenase PutA n=1 Tax=Parvularcula sp. IMCC14364 TaxID=3067902 RepID=UPI0027422383|nr:bifunctional proline dehydrogenase/L-glutamate gamma-semialdehyde dehydrogenase PutA [Parvularcula sp. IMCC14364]
MAEMHPPFCADYAPDETRVVEDLLERNQFSEELDQSIRKRAERFVAGIRDKSIAGGGAGLEEFMQEYSLSTREGLALMVLAEALLRVPDAVTQNRLIEEKLSDGDWDDLDGDESWLIQAASWGIGMSSWVMQPGQTPAAILKKMTKRLGMPVIRTGTRQAMQFLGHHFVLGQTIGEGLRRAQKERAKGFRFSFDMLGEGARTSADAEKYYQAYEEALSAIGEDARTRDTALPDRPGLSVKLSAIHPRYELRQQKRVMAELVPKLLKLAQQAKTHDLNFTVDAEEADRLELSLMVFEAVASDTSLAGWDGFGLAIQAYQKRAPEVIEWVDKLSQKLRRRFMVRLVKGAYWDTEIKRAQERGLEGFPVFTKKAATDLCYLDCACKLLAARPRLFPQFATHNAHTLASILEMAGDTQGYEFQRLHGMGEALYNLEMTIEGVPARIYAPVGGYKDLLAYLVRRLLENSANSSFVAQVADDKVSMDELLRSPQDELSELIYREGSARQKLIRLPAQMFEDRPNSKGAELGYAPHLQALSAAVSQSVSDLSVSSVVNGGPLFSADTRQDEIINPATGVSLGSAASLGQMQTDKVFAAAKAALVSWSATPVKDRAGILRRFAHLLEANRDRLMSLLTAEAGKTMDDALAEIREAVDFCHYYAVEAEQLFGAHAGLPGPVGEANTRHVVPRGVFVCISPWNFPLAIFLGQITAALACGNTVVAKPAEQTPLIAHAAMTLLKEAGLPDGVCNLAIGDGEIGRKLVEHPAVSGVVFTGSTQTARNINRTLAAKEGPIVPLIAETGGINAMIVDSTALPEQVADDVAMSAFRSAGQRCSALRLLFLQEDVADRMLEMIIGAAEELRLGDPGVQATDVGPVIDQEAQANLNAHIASMKEKARLVWAGDLPTEPNGYFVPPHIFELSSFDDLQSEAFGPILHVCRWRASELDNVIKAINNTGYGLTFGLHSRLETLADYVVPRIHAGNIYINRNTIGAIVGVQPFGGMGLSGTGPKAGGPLYLTRFVEEKTVSNNTTAAGGNASLIAMSD